MQSVVFACILATDWDWLCPTRNLTDPHEARIWQKLMAKRSRQPWERVAVPSVRGRGAINSWACLLAWSLYFAFVRQWFLISKAGHLRKCIFVIVVMRVARDSQMRKISASNLHNKCVLCIYVQQGMDTQLYTWMWNYSFFIMSLFQNYPIFNLGMFFDSKKTQTPKFYIVDDIKKHYITKKFFNGKSYDKKGACKSLE